MVNFNELRKQRFEIEAGGNSLVRSFETEMFSSSPWLIPNDLDLTSEYPEVEIQVHFENSDKPLQSEEEIQVSLIEEETVVKEKVDSTTNSTSITQSNIIKTEISFPVQAERDIKILFMGDTVDSGISFKADNSDMLGRMILAMNLEEGDFARASGDEDVFETIAKLRPLVIVTLGAAATNLLLGKKEKLTSVHGKIFKSVLEYDQGEKIDVTFVPVFHPDYLEINPSMKRSAWVDLQKVLDYLNN